MKAISEFYLMLLRLLFSLFCCLITVLSIAQKIDSQVAQKLEEAKNIADSEPERSFSLVSEVLQNNISEGPLIKAKAHQLQGQLLYQFALYQEAVEALYISEELFKELNCQPCLAETHNSLGEIYYKIKSPEAALARHEQALSIYKNTNNVLGMAKTLGFIGTMNEKLEDYSKALSYQWEAMDLVKSAKDISAFAIVLENIGSIKEDLEEYDSAKYFFQKSYELHLIAGDSSNMIGNLNNLGDAYRKSGDFEKGLEYSKLAMDMSDRLGNTYQLRSATVDVAKSLQLLGEFSEAYDYLELSRQLNDQIFSEEAARQLAIREVQYELNKKITQLAEFEHRHEKEILTRWLLSLIVLALIVLAWLMLNRQKIKIRSSRDLLERQKELLEIKEKLIATEKENINLLEARMAAEVESHSQSLSAQTLHVIEKNQMLGEIQQKLKRILEEDSKEQKKRIRNLIKQIDYNFSQDTDWEDYKNSFEKVHQDFFKNLHKNSKDLTPGELKLASLMRMNLSSKEIASTLGISQESLRISRYRLRKKLNLEKGENLQQFLLCI